MKPTSTLKAFLWAFCLMLVTAAKAQGPYSYINGPAESCPGKEETYFYSYNGFTGFIFQSCTLTVHGGVFLPNNTTTLVQHMGSFKVRWNTTTSGIIYGKMRYKIYDNGPYSETINKAVVMAHSVSSIIVPPQAEGSNYDLSCSYPFSSSYNASGYEWSVSGNATLSATSGKQVNLLTTGAAGTATLGLRVLGCSGWSDWTYKTVNVAPVAPTVSLSGTSALTPGSRYTFTASGASAYEWSTSGGITLVSTTGNQAVIQAHSDFTSGMVYVRGRNCGTWSSYATRSLFLDCTVPFNVKITGTTALCPDRSYTFTASADWGTEYEWSMSGSYASTSRSGNKLTVRPSSSFSGGTISVRSRYRSYCQWSAWQTINLTRSSSCCSYSLILTLSEGFNATNLCYLSRHTILVSGTRAERYEWRITGNAYPISPTVTTNNWVDIQTNGGNGTISGNNVTIEVIAYYCGGAGSTIGAKTFNCHMTNCGPGSTRKATEEEAQTSGVYPNPVNEGAKLSLHVSGVEISQVKVYDKVGQLVKQLPGNHDTEMEVSTSDLKPGMYVMQVLGAAEVRSYKFTVE